MEALESQEREEGTNGKDPYHEVITKSEHSGRVRLYGKGVTKSKLKEVDSNADFIFPQELLQSLQKKAEQKLQAANPGKDLVIPELFDGVTSTIASNGASNAHESSGGQLIVTTNSSDQVQDLVQNLDGPSRCEVEEDN